ncbi:MAG: hypothetical protein AB7O59_05260 [Pirellulales bacterium]
MTTFSVVRDDGPTEVERRMPTTVPPAPFRRAPLARKIHIELPRATRPEVAESLPTLVLELPDLVAVGEPSTDRWQTLGNRVFWAGIVLGALLAIALVWNPGRKSRPAIDAAPTWSPKASTQLPEHKAATTASAAHRGSQAPAWPPVSRNATTAAEPAAAAPPISVAPVAAASDTDAAVAEPVGQLADPSQSPTGEGHAEQAPPVEPLEGPPPGREAAPSFDEWSRPNTGQPQARTAQSPSETRWDGTAPRVEPGEAAPVGRIINQR